MANVFSPFGFRQFRRLDGGAPTAGFDALSIASSDTNLYFTGDLVATNTTGPYITTAVSTGQNRGVFLGCEFFSPTVNRRVWSPFFPGSVQTSSGTNDALAWVCTDPDMMWVVQTSTTAVVGSSMIGLNFAVSTASLSSQGNQTTGISNMSLGSSTFSSTNGLPFRLMDFFSNWTVLSGLVGGQFNFANNQPGPNTVINGTDNTSAGMFVVVAPNNWDRKNNTGI